MRAHKLGLLGALLLTGAEAMAQAPVRLPVSSAEAGVITPVPNVVKPATPAPVAPPALTTAPVIMTPPSAATNYALPLSTPTPVAIANDNEPVRFWMDAGYLLYWVKDAPVSNVLVTTGNPTVNGLNAGAIGLSTTNIIYGGGGNKVDFGTNSGFRFSIGAWFDNAATRGIEFGGLFLEKRDSNFFAANSGTGTLGLYLPGFNVVTGLNNRLLIADPLLGFAGDVSIRNTTEFWGLEVNGLRNISRDSDSEFSILGGFRYLDLDESLSMVNNTSDLVLGGIATLRDQFRTYNSFYGAQLGARYTLQSGRFSFGVAGKVALGVTNSILDVNGSITQPNGTTTAGGFFAQTSNSGRRSEDNFAVVPEVNLKVGIDLLPGFRAIFGYDFIYWSSVMRAGEQVSNRLNLSQNPIVGGGALIGPAHPQALMKKSDYFAQGLRFGFELRY